MQACLNILRASLIAARVELSVSKYPGVIAAPLVIGTIAGSGGKLVQDGIQLACGSLAGQKCPIGTAMLHFVTDMLQSMSLRAFLLACFLPADRAVLHLCCM